MRWFASFICVAFLLAGNAAAREPGTLISARPMTGMPEGARAWRISYWTTDLARRPTRSTGVVVAPIGAGANRPVLAWQHGTIGIAKSCAPSAKKTAFTSIPGLADAVGRGIVVAATDYPGLGTDGPHAYLVAEAAAAAAIDAVRAARAIPAASAGNRFALWGHSQGAHASLSAAIRARSRAPELELVTVVAASPPTDLVANFTAASGAPRSFLSGFIGASWEKVYSAPLSTLGNRTTADIIRRVGKRCLGDASTLSSKVDVVRLLVRLNDVDLAATEPWRSRLAENSVAPAGFGVPMLVTQGDADDLVIPRVTQAFVSRLCSAGEAVRYVEVPGGDHAANAIATAPTAIDWIAARFAGQPATSTCR